MSYRDLTAWNKAMDFVIPIYDYANRLPESEKFGLFQQLRRAVVSIPSNISEGHGRNSKPELARFCFMALGSVREIQTQLEICQRLGYGQAQIEIDQAEQLAKIIYALAKSMRSDP